MIFDELTVLLDEAPHPAALNMAIDEVLLRGACAPLLRVYRWDRPAVSFGYFSRWAEVAATWPGRELVRRWTGGGVVPHGADVTYTLVVPRGFAVFEMGAAECYRLVHECIAGLLGDQGALAEAAAQKVSDACFENAARHDVLLAGRKVAGAAQRRTRQGLLHQGSIQCAGPALEEAVRRGLPGALAKICIARPLGVPALEEAAALALERYGTAAWTRRF